MSGIEEAIAARGGEAFELDVPYMFEDNPQDFDLFNHLICEMVSKTSTPVGLFIPMDSMALYVMQTCQQLGLHVPNDLNQPCLRHRFPDQRPAPAFLIGMNPAGSSKGWWRYV